MEYRDFTLQGNEGAAEIFARVTAATPQHAKLAVLHESLVLETEDPLHFFKVALVFESVADELEPSMDAKIRLLVERKGYAYDYLMFLAKARSSLESRVLNWSRSSPTEYIDMWLEKLHASLRLKKVYDAALEALADHLENMTGKLEGTLPDHAPGVVGTIRETLGLHVVDPSPPSMRA